VQKNRHLWPNFFIVGAPKTGTTSLYHYLRQHPQIYLSPVKEPCYFASEVRLESFSREFVSGARRKSLRLRQFLEGPMTGIDPGGIVANLEDYLSLFKNVDGETAIGEASVCYLWSPTAAANIRSRIPEAKIVIILRDPAERAFSQYLQYAATGLVGISFREHIERSARNTRREFRTLYPLLEYGLYYRQVKAYLELFPNANIQIYFYEEAWRDPPAFLRALFEFLEVDSGFTVDVSRRNLQRRAPRVLTSYYLFSKSGIGPRLKALAPKAIRDRARPLLFKSHDSLRMDASDRRYLCDYYRDDVRNLSSLLDRDLGAWLK
jgi:Sulfotransferase family